MIDTFKPPRSQKKRFSRIWKFNSNKKRFECSFRSLGQRNSAESLISGKRFWDCFQSSVDDNNELAEVDKFLYLRHLLEEPAKSFVAGF